MRPSFCGRRKCGAFLFNLVKHYLDISQRVLEAALGLKLVAKMLHSTQGAVETLHP
jgi:hypothetical protein